MDYLKVRKALNLTQAEAARRIGVTEKTWCRWEYGDCKPLWVFVPMLEKMELEAASKSVTPVEEK